MARGALGVRDAAGTRLVGPVVYMARRHTGARRGGGGTSSSHEMESLLPLLPALRLPRPSPSAPRDSPTPSHTPSTPSVHHTMSWFSAAAPTGPVIHPVQLRFGQEALFGPLVKEDTQWLCAGGFITETQTFYATTSSGALVMCQVIHSSVG